MGHDSANQRHDVDSIDFAIIIGVVGTGGWIWQRYEKPEAIVVTTLLALVLFVMRYSATFWQLLAYLYENTSNEDVGYVARGSLMADVIPGIARALPQERPVKSFVTTQQPRLLPPPKDVTSSETVIAPHVSRKPVDVTETRSTGERVMLRKEVVTLPNGRTVDLPREVTELPILPEFDFGSNAPAVAGPALLSSEALLKVLGEASHISVTGPTKAGKTTFLSVLCYGAMRDRKNVLVLDPHATPGKWPTQARVIGAGRNYPAIEAALKKLEKLMQDRYNEMAIGLKQEGEHDPIFVIADEWRAIIGEIKTAGKLLSTLICEARKARISICLGAHSHFLTGLGLEDSAIRGSLEICHLKIEDGRRHAEINGKKYNLPEPLPRELFSISKNHAEMDPEMGKRTSEMGSGSAGNGETEDSKKEKVHELLRQKIGIRDIIRQVWGVDSGNSYYKAAGELSGILAELANR